MATRSEHSTNDRRGRGGNLRLTGEIPVTGRSLVLVLLYNSDRAQPSIHFEALSTLHYVRGSKNPRDRRQFHFSANGQ